MRIGMLGVAFEVHEPPELIDRMRTLGERFTQAARKSESRPAVS